MNDSAEINSAPWWESYFRHAWEQHGGPEQSRHFMQRLLAELPPLDRALLAEGSLTFLDWGCAFGDGTDELARAFPKSTVAGLDAAGAALAAARQRYPRLAFVQADPAAAAGALDRDFDVVVSSNCIEHFDSPLQVLRANLARTRLLHLTLVPYRELPLAVHHTTTFDEDSFPPSLDGFERLHLRIIDVDPAYWPSGKQLLVAYASGDYLRRRAAFEPTFRERAKWDAYYGQLPRFEIDPLTRTFNDELVGAVRELLPAGGRLLEAGCGGGSQSLALAKAGFEVALLDFSPAALDYARRSFDEAGASAEFIEDDAFAAGEPRFDLVFNAGVLEHYTLQEQARFLRGMASRSRRYVLVLIPNRACYWYWLWRIRKAAAGDWPFGREVPQTTLADAFAAAGIEYLGERFLGAGWTESFIESFDGIDADTRALLLEVHRSAVLPDSGRGYLLAALGSVAGDDRALPRWGGAGHSAADGRAQEQWTAMLADALAGRIAAAQQAEQQARQFEATLQATHAEHAAALASKAAELQQAQSRVGELRLEIARRLDELNVASGKLMESQRQLQEISDWARRTEQRSGELAERLRTLEDLDRRRFTRRLGRLWRLLTTQPPREWARRIYRRLPLSPARRHRIGLLVNRWRGRLPRAGAALPPVQASAALRTGSGADVFVFAIIDWHFRIQRPQQMARALVRRGHRVFYVSNHFVDDASPGYALEPLDESLPIYQLRLHARGAPPIYFDTAGDATTQQLRGGLAQLLLRAQPARALVLIEHPYWWDLSAMLPNATFVYDCMDHHEGFGNVPTALLELEGRLIEAADEVIVTSQWLADRLRRHRPDAALIRNACDYDVFAAAPVQVERDAAGRRTIGYFGAIAEWFDVELVRAVARAYPQARVRLIGNDTVDARGRLADCANVELTGELPYASLPAHLHGFDVCLLPFRKLPLTMATNPVKVYEYLAAGKPVVAVDLPEVAQFGELVIAAGDADAFVDAVGRALQAPADADLRERRRAFAASQTWSRRIDALEQALQQRQEPRVSVVVLTYNNLPLTQACLASVERESDYANLELIIVDNASTDGSRLWLREFAAARPAVKLILNDENRGFAAGNNQGLAQAGGEFLVVLNNDTVVTRGWLRTLIKHFRRAPKLGVLGPVTNNIGNEAKIDIGYADLAAMPAHAAAYTLAHGGSRRPLRTAAFFCVMLRRAVYEQLGGLSEDYGAGFFEDDDYCRRVEAAGWQIACAEDVFVHHELSASFGKMPGAERQRLFERNLRRYESKWGKWQPHRYRADGTAAGSPEA